MFPLVFRSCGPSPRQRRNSNGLRQSAHQQVVSDAWLPKSDMTSVRLPPQNGQGGAASGSAHGDLHRGTSRKGHGCDRARRSTALGGAPGPRRRSSFPAGARGSHRQAIGPPKGGPSRASHGRGPRPRQAAPSATSSCWTPCPGEDATSRPCPRRLATAQRLRPNEARRTTPRRTGGGTPPGSIWGLAPRERKWPPAILSQRRPRGRRPLHRGATKSAVRKGSSSAEAELYRWPAGCSPEGVVAERSASSTAAGRAPIRPAPSMKPPFRFDGRVAQNHRCSGCQAALGVRQTRRGAPAGKGEAVNRQPPPGAGSAPRVRRPG